MPFSELIYTHWEAVLVMFAALVLMPKGLLVLGLPAIPYYWIPAISLCTAYLFFPAPFAPLLGLPYLVVACWTAIREGVDLLVYRHFTLPSIIRVAALAYWATGAAWAFCFLAHIQPLGFDPTIVGLTAAHFHVAGFVLSTVIYALLVTRPGLFTRMLGKAALLGMPLVALGITLTKWGATSSVEGGSSLLFAGMALAVAAAQLSQFGQKNLPRRARWCWLGGAGCLLIGAILASLYALRFQWPLAWINIPNLKVWHGSLNAVGFGWLSLHGWQVALSGSMPSDRQISKLYPSARN